MKNIDGVKLNGFKLSWTINSEYVYNYGLIQKIKFKFIFHFNKKLYLKHIEKLHKLNKLSYNYRIDRILRTGSYGILGGIGPLGITGPKDI